MRTIERLKRLFRKKETTTNIKKIMAKKTVITKVLDADAQDGIIEFPQNRTLYADQFTD